MARRSRRREARDRGSTTVEVAVLLPLMMLLLMAVVQVGLWFHVRAVMATAANQGVDAARVDQGTAAQGEQATREFLSETEALREVAVDVERSTDTASVTVSGRVVSLLWGVPLAVSVTIDAPVEQVAP